MLRTIFFKVSGYFANKKTKQNCKYDLWIHKRCIKMLDLEKMAQRCSRSKAIRHRQQQEQPQEQQQQQQIICLLKCPTITLKPSLYEVLYCLSSLRLRAILAVGHSCLSPHDVISRQVYKQTNPRLLLCMRVPDTTCLWNCPDMTYQTE